MAFLLLFVHSYFGDKKSWYKRFQTCLKLLNPKKCPRLNTRLTQININSSTNSACVPRLHLSPIIFFSSFDIHVDIIRFNRLRLSILHEMRIVSVLGVWVFRSVEWKRRKKKRNHTQHLLQNRTKWNTKHTKHKSTKKKLFVNLKERRIRETNSNTCFSIYTNYMTYSILFPSRSLFGFLSLSM